VPLDVVERPCLPVGENESLGVRVIAVGAELQDHPVPRIVHTLRAPLVGNVVGGHAQVLRGVVGAQVGAVTQHRPVLHQAAGLVDLLAPDYVVLSEEHLTGFAEHLVGQGH
jgi:hypothetical protein